MTTFASDLADFADLLQVVAAVSLDLFFRKNAQNTAVARTLYPSQRVHTLEVFIIREHAYNVNGLIC